MAIRMIVKEGDSVLRETAKQVTKFNSNLHKLLDDMADTMYDAPGVGLAAPQVGILKRVIVMDVGDENGLIEIVNPVVVEQSGEQIGPEGCLSIPGLEGEVKRPFKVKVKGQDRNGEEFELEGEELLARCIMHEVDHLNGVLFTDLAIRLYRPELEEKEER
ncbi:peptide deformylase [Paenibacillus chitinolyticus]|uniref:Peptide deformylase n=1 Tax=Paenibacillus chitinolyticus TaxID=79263 RepID=A0A410X0T9_9BACL|nr:MULTISPECIES: peptide deformylase [Paenibacillus]MCY9588464.1 peptide deformylase [Paenibacillus chitinolyticus]MCY9597834.1 peptide deformylase [Paenibacillus chitinolyticus]QAV20217.1 peptide deformylase [Paenibacillus chitinolyticus]GKS10120.1 peptide deformylase [Paenibacillus chitinolyticus]